MNDKNITIQLIKRSVLQQTPQHKRTVPWKPNDPLFALAKQIENEHAQTECVYVGAIVDEKLVSLSYKPQTDCQVQLLDLSHPEGQRLYQRTALFILQLAARDILPTSRLRIEHTLSNGIYGEFHNVSRFLSHDVDNLKKRMQEIVEADLPIRIEEVSLEQAKHLVATKQTQLEQHSLMNLLEQLSVSAITLHSIDGFVDYTDGPLLPSTGYVRHFQLHHYMPGFILQIPEKADAPVIPTYREQPKLTGVYREAERWADVMQIRDITALNNLTDKQMNDLISINEAFHEKKIARIADEIASNPYIRLITIAGPSSSGKTTFSQRLLIQLKVNGLHPLTLHLDDYFLSREDTPLDEDGNPDFEALEAVDLALFNDHLSRLIEGDTVEVPTFDFTDGTRKWTGRTLKLAPDQPVIVEGIHGLNDRLTEAIPKASKYKIYISALTQLNIHDRVRIHTTDARLLRRLVRDAQFRSHDATATLQRWPLVRRGEERNIFPFQEDADVMINSALLYELAVLKPYAVEQLRSVAQDAPERVMADHLLWLLSHIKERAADAVPANSILREFIGGSSFT